MCFHDKERLTKIFVSLLLFQKIPVCFYYLECVRNWWLENSWSAEVGGVRDADGGGGGGFEFEENDFVRCVRPEQRSRKIERLLRSDVPKPAEVEAVDPDVTLRKTVETHETVVLAFCGKTPPEKLGKLCRAARPIQLVEIVEGETRDVEVHQGLIVEHKRGDALAVVEMFAVIDASRCVHEHRYFVAFFHPGSDK